MKEVQINEVKIRVDEHNNVYISGHNKLTFESNGDVDIKGKRLTLTSEEETTLLSGNHLVQKAVRIDLNPDEEDDEYVNFRKEKGLI